MKAPEATASLEEVKQHLEATHETMQALEALNTPEIANNIRGFRETILDLLQNVAELCEGTAKATENQKVSDVLKIIIEMLDVPGLSEAVRSLGTINTQEVIDDASILGITETATDSDISLLKKTIEGFRKSILEITQKAKNLHEDTKYILAKKGKGEVALNALRDLQSMEYYDAGTFKVIAIEAVDNVVAIEALKIMVDICEEEGGDAIKILGEIEQNSQVCSKVKDGASRMIQELQMIQETRKRVLGN